MNWKLMSLMCLSISLAGCDRQKNAVDLPMEHPIKLVISDIDSPFPRMGYILDAQTKRIVMLDMQGDDPNYIDTADGDSWGVTPLPAGQNPIGLVLDDRKESHRLYSVDADQNLIWGFEMTFADRDDPVWEVLDLGTQTVGITTPALFFNRGVLSSGSLQDIVSSSSLPGLNAWRVRYEGSEAFSLRSSVFGTLDSKAKTNQTFESDEADISFKIQEGLSEFNAEDRFYFSSMMAKPLQLSGTPIDFEKHDNRVFIMLQAQEVFEMVIFDLDTLSISTAATLALSSPTSMHLDGDLIYITNDLTAEVEVFDTSSQSVELISISDQPLVKPSLVMTFEDNWYIFDREKSRVFVWNPTSKETIKELVLSSTPESIQKFEKDNMPYAMVSLRSGDVEILDLTKNVLVDTRPEDEVGYSSIQFFDEGDNSSPSIVSVGTFKDQTREEYWQVIYGGIAPDLHTLNVMIEGSDVNLTDAALNLLDRLGSPDQWWVDISGTLHEVSQVLSNDALTLTKSSSLQGLQKISVRCKDSYLVMGSVSGVQSQCANADTLYTTDEGEISFFVRSSLTEPATVEDTFSFYTESGVTPIRAYTSRQSVTIARSLAGDIAVISDTASDKHQAFVLYSGDGAIGRINLNTLYFDKFIL